MYWSLPEDVEAMLAGEAVVGTVQRWKCPCDALDCKGYVIYCRDKVGGFSFMATQSFQAEPPYPIFRVDNIEDFTDFVSDERINISDRTMYALWFHMGLREVILSA